jgi:hypothetical protein
MDSGTEFLLYAVALIISLVVLFAVVRLFSIDSTLKEIRDLMQRQVPPTPLTPAIPEEEKIRIGNLQQNWPGYSSASKKELPADASRLDRMAGK